MAEKEVLLKPGQQIKPSISAEEVCTLVNRFFNLTVNSMKELNSYDDRSYYITVFYLDLFRDFKADFVYPARSKITQIFLTEMMFVHMDIFLKSLILWILKTKDSSTLKRTWCSFWVKMSLLHSTTSLLESFFFLYKGRNGISCPRPIRDVQGNYTALVTLSESDDENCGTVIMVYAIFFILFTCFTL